MKKGQKVQHDNDDDPMAEYEAEEKAKIERANREWVVFSYGGEYPRVFYVRKSMKSIYYDEAGDKIAYAETYSVKEKEEAEKVAQAFADKLNQNPELALALLEYTYERDILKTCPVPVAKRRQADG